MKRLNELVDFAATTAWMMLILLGIVVTGAALVGLVEAVL